jgi:anti-anti-sigma factor
VSGHDLQAAYLSAYFQGVVRGMLERGAPMPEVFTFFNRLLLEEWNGLKHSDAGTSTAVCALLLDFPRQTVKVITCGSPAPVYVAPEGRAEMLAESGGFPLGWFAEYTVSSVSHATTAGGAFFLWSDGLEDLAAQNGVSTLSMGFILQRARLNQRPPTEVAAAADDVLFAEVGLPAGTPEPARWQPLVFEGYHGGQAAEIDQLQARWSRSLQRAVPELTGNLLYDLLLASREAVLNALRHGCHDDPGQWATFQISYLPVEQSFRVWVDDPGAGHDFDLAAHERAVEMSSWHDGITAPGGAERLVEKHRGLILMKRLSRRLRFERHGAGIIMDFKPASPPEGPLIPLEPPAAPPLREKPAHTADARKPTTQFDAQHKVLAITIDGDLTSTRVKELMAELEPALAVPAGESAPWEIVALHLPTARMVDSMGLNLLVKIFKTAHQAGGRLQLVCPNANVHRTLMFTRLDRQMELIKG